MKLLHTSDWHLGRSLYGKKRYDEFEQFLDWLSDTIKTEEVDVLLVSGDVFDTRTPGNRAQELYYRFLKKVSSMPCCSHVVIVAGNHDSPSFLNAPGELLRVLNVYVIGAAQEPENEVIEIRDSSGLTKALVCAVPYLRDKDIRTIEPGETIDKKNSKLVAGLRDHYADVCSIAEKRRAELQESGAGRVPVVAMGHLFTAGGKTVDGDGVRELYVGSLAHIDKDTFPSSIDYFALGHLHVPQSVGGATHMRYSGSPIALGYGEATQEKQVILIEFDGTTPNVRTLAVPCFQQLVRIVGSLDDILTRIDKLKMEESTAWLEIEYTGSDIISDLRETLDEALEGSAMEIRRIKNKRVMDGVIGAIEEGETLDNLDTGTVFFRCLDLFEVPDEDRIELRASYDEIVRSIQEEDVNEL